MSRIGEGRCAYGLREDRIVMEMVSEERAWHSIGDAIDKTGSSVENRFYHLAKAYDPRSIGHSQRSKTRKVK